MDESLIALCSKQDIPGSDEKPTLQLKYMRAVNQHFRSNKANPTSFHTIPPILSTPPTCLTLLAFATTFSSSVKNLALSGVSGKKKYATGDIQIVGKPSTKNSNRQFASLECPLVIP